MSNSFVIGGAPTGQVSLDLGYANRHGLIAGATGTGKTVTVQILAEQFSKAGVPVFLADVKGDVSGIAVPGKTHPKISERIDRIGLTDFEFSGTPVTFWDIFTKYGTPLRITISEMGPQLLSRLLNLNDTQESILTLAFEFADDEGMLLLDINDLKTTLNYLAENTHDLKAEYGTISKASINAIHRKIMVIDRDGGDIFFGEPAIKFSDFKRRGSNGHGMINILDARTVINQPRTYTTFLLWMMSEMFETLPEVGDPEKPEMVFFFDEAHLLFNDVPKVFLEKIEQVVRLIRSKGVGIYFITQSPSDIPDSVLGQLGNRIQHALRAYTPKERKAVKTAAQSFRTNPDLDTEEVISKLACGEALVSVLQQDGIPSIVQQTLIRPPYSRIGPLTQKERKAIIEAEPLERIYRQPVDPVSAHEQLKERAKKMLKDAEIKQQQQAKNKAKPRGRSRQSVGEAFMKSVARSLGSAAGRKIIRGILGSILR